MLRWHIVVAVFLGSGCLDPLASDAPGYSRYLLPSDARVPSSADEYELDHKFDLNDGVETGTVEPRLAFAAGGVVQYWDLGVAKSSITPVYVLTECDAASEPLADGLLDHPALFGSAPGDADYSAFRSLYMVCVTPRYAGELITSLEALSDAIDMRLVKEPNDPLLWVNLPIVAAGVTLELGGGESAGVREGYYQQKRVGYLDLSAEEGEFPYVDKRIKAPNVYELKRAGEEGTSQVVFAQGPLDGEGRANPRYAPAVKVVAVTLAAEADLAQFRSEADLVSVGEDGSLTPAHEHVLSAEPSGETHNRPQRALEAP